MKRLYKSQKDKKIEGVCGGLGEYFNLDATLVRVAFAAATLFSGVVPGVILYVVLAVIMPKEA
jgi:phage shock protein C